MSSLVVEELLFVVGLRDWVSESEDQTVKMRFLSRAVQTEDWMRLVIERWSRWGWELESLR
jgi:hypothetical protein